jgi:CubicO group peptidase (beta-lactamase class C family)
MPCQTLSLRRIFYMIIFLISIVACTHTPPRVDESGAPQREYTYQTPIQIDDGWEISSLKAEGVDSEPIEDLIGDILKEEFKNIDSVLLVKNGKLILEEYFNEYNHEDLHQIRSATKSIGSVLTGIAIDKGFIRSENETIYPYFKSYETEEKWDERVREVTLKSLMTMTSGYDCDDMKGNYNCETDMYKSDDWVEYALNLQMAYNPGEHWAYNSASLWLVGEIISKESNMLIPEFADKYLFGPLGIKDFKWWYSPQENAWLAGGSEMKPRDMAKFGYMVLGQGNWRGIQIVSKEWIDRSTKEHVRNSGGYWGYGYLWWIGKTVINKQEIDVILASGNGGQKIYIFPKLELVAIFTGGNYGSDLSSQPDQMLINYILPAMIPASQKVKFVDLEQNSLNQFIGQYSNKESRMNASLVIESNKLVLYLEKPDGEEIIGLLPLADRKFYGNSEEVGDLTFTFSKGGETDAEHFAVHGGFGFTRLQFERVE